MGVDTHLYIGSRWTIEDVAAVVECTEGRKAELRPSEHSPAAFGSVHLDGGWFCHYHLGADTPLGRAIMLSRRHSEETVSSFSGIAEVIGGALEEKDSNGLVQFYMGRLWEEDGLAYFVKHAVLRGHSGEADREGVKALREAINGWIERVDPRRGRV